MGSFCLMVELHWSVLYNLDLGSFSSFDTPTFFLNSNYVTEKKNRLQKFPHTGGTDLF